MPEKLLEKKFFDEKKLLTEKAEARDERKANESTSENADAKINARAKKGSGKVPQEHNKVVLLPIDDISPSPFQARTVFDEQEIKKLAVSILQNGLLQPISVRPIADGRYQLVAGERRLRACRLVGLETIPAIVFQFEDNQTAALGLLENMQREQLNPFEQARALRDLLSLWNCTQEVAARKLGIAQPTLANKLRLLTLTVEQEKICTDNDLTERHARAVLRLPTPESRTMVLLKAVERHYNVMQTEELVEKLVQGRRRPKRRMMVRDVRIFINTIDRAVHMMTAGGIPATAKKSENADYIEYVVRIPTKAAEAKPTPKPRPKKPGIKFVPRGTNQ